MTGLSPGVDFGVASAAVRRTLDSARLVTESEAVVLWRGENDTGKCVLAHPAHGWSRRGFERGFSARDGIARGSCPS
jgi:transcriptional regulator with GAF, ATPase, and Fis domain